MRTYLQVKTSYHQLFGHQNKQFGLRIGFRLHRQLWQYQDLIDCFNREECDELFAVKMLRESVNLTNIEKGVITQLDSTIGSFYQMMGRTLRHEFPELHIFVVDNTQDIKYFENSMKDFDEKYVKYS